MTPGPSNPEFRPIPELDTGTDHAAWLDRFHLLAYFLGMSADQIAETDNGYDPDDPEKWQVYSWARYIETAYPLIDVRPMIEACRKIAPC